MRLQQTTFENILWQKKNLLIVNELFAVSAFSFLEVFQNTLPKCFRSDTENDQKHVDELN